MTKKMMNSLRTSAGTLLKVALSCGVTVFLFRSTR